MSQTDGTAGPKPEEDPRVYLAGERTLLAWVRTGLTMIGLGFVVARFGLLLRGVTEQTEGPTYPSGLSLWGGTVLVILGAVVNFLAAIEYRQFLRDYRRGLVPQPGRVPLGVILATVVAMIGVAMAVYLVYNS